MKEKPTQAIRDAVAIKKRGRKPTPKQPIEFKDGLKNIGTIETISIADIDLEDRRFQYRVSEKAKDLVPSLMNEGQLVPVILWGNSKPYKIIDGFRRTQAIKLLEWPNVKAIIHRSISEEDAYRISFIENFKRKSFSPIDIAHAVWKAQARGKNNEALQEEFHLSKRQLFRYKAMIEFSDSIKAALAEGTITMAHAQILHSFNVTELIPWFLKIKRGLSAKELKKLLLKESGPRTKPRKYFKKEKDGFRLYPIRYIETAPAKYREEIIRILEEALKIAKSGK